MDSLVMIVQRLKNAALNSKLANEVVLIKSERDLGSISEDSNFRSVYISIEDADLDMYDDYYNISFVIVDKASEETDDAYLYSIEEGISLLRIMSDTLNYNTSNTNVSVQYSDVKISSGLSGSGLITWIDANMKYSFKSINNISINE